MLLEIVISIADLSSYLFTFIGTLRLEKVVLKSNNIFKPVI